MYVRWNVRAARPWCGWLSAVMVVVVSLARSTNARQSLPALTGAGRPRGPQLLRLHGNVHVSSRARRSPRDLHLRKASALTATLITVGALLVESRHLLGQISFGQNPPFSLGRRYPPRSAPMPSQSRNRARLAGSSPERDLCEVRAGGCGSLFSRLTNGCALERGVGLSPTADVPSHTSGAASHEETNAPQQTASLDHLVGATEQ
jgi:hypothetical protein